MGAGPGYLIASAAREQYLEQLQLLRSDSAKQSWEQSSDSLLELHNNL